jgi:5-methylcytosine-specific restriction endonuclease McrA
MDKETIDHICNILREGTVTWSGRSECLRTARKKVVEGWHKNGKEKIKLYWQCAACKSWFRDASSMEVDHIDPIGKRPESADGLLEYIKRMYCDQSNLQALCTVCHKKKTVSGAANRKFERKR